MQRRKRAIGLIVSISVLAWLVLLAMNLIILFSAANHITSIVPMALPRLAFVTFSLTVFAYCHWKLSSTETANFSDLLWQVFVTGMITAAISLLVRVFFMIFSNSSIAENPLTINFFYHVNIALIVVFSVSTFLVWKRLVLYQKSRSLLRLWKVFEYALLVTLIADLFNIDFLELPFILIVGLTSLLGLIIAFNLKWVAYLNFNQKLRSLLFLVLVGIYLFYFSSTLLDFSLTGTLVFDLANSEIIASLFIFISLYASTSFLVILFNLPTSSVFENKLKEIIDFQKLSRSIAEGSNPDQIYTILMDSAVSGVYADLGIIALYDTEKKAIRKFYSSESETIEEDQWHSLLNEISFRKSIGSVSIGSSENINYPSALKTPIISQKQEIGSILLLKNVIDGFDREMASIVDTFVNQASISLENINLLHETLETERYQEELKIASRVQERLLPSELANGSDIDIAAKSIPADEVGGDYYDVFWHGPKKLSLIIGDVSGKGTSAAFNMSQMKGVFHSLVNLNLKPDSFITHANDALSRCLERSSFITATYFVIDLENKVVHFVRAGHCPTLYYNKQKNSSEYFESKGLGLGLLRNSNYENYVNVNEFHYQPGDIIVLYTDGIVEACNLEKERYGYDRLKKSLMKHAQLCSEQIQKNMIDDLYEFCENSNINDDYTIVVVKLI